MATKNTKSTKKNTKQEEEIGSITIAPEVEEAPVVEATEEKEAEEPETITPETEDENVGAGEADDNASESAPEPEDEKTPEVIEAVAERGELIADSNPSQIIPGYPTSIVPDFEEEPKPVVMAERLVVKEHLNNVIAASPMAAALR